MKLRTKLCLASASLLMLSGYASSLTPQQVSGTPQVVAPSESVIDAYVAEVRSNLSTGKVKVINDLMKLSPAEAAIFWPIYAEYEQDLFALGDRRLELMKKFVAAQAAGTLDNTAADALASDWLRLQRNSVELMETYYGRLAKEMSPLRAVQFVQIEHRTNIVIDLMIASQMPLVTVDSSDRK